MGEGGYQIVNTVNIAPPSAITPRAFKTKGVAQEAIITNNGYIKR
jgi:hypothetical protein